MTTDENIATEPREARHFRFLKNGTAFFPGVGAQLHFASKAEDTLTLPAMPSGMFAAGDAVTVQWSAAGADYATVFAGTVVKIIDRAGRGSDRVNDVTVGGPWAKLNRLVFRQVWYGTAANFYLSRVVLNRAVTGADLTMTGQLAEILDFAKKPCGFAVGEIAAGTTVLPADDARDLTCASAIQRELRFHPKVITRFDYAASTPTLHITQPEANEAAYVASIPKTAREYELNATPISSVDVQTNDITIESGGSVLALGHQVYPADADTAALDCLHVYVPLASGSASNTYESCTLETEEIISGGISMPQFWKTYHPRLANVAESAIKISEATRTGTHSYPYIAKNSAAEMGKAHIHFERETFKCKCTITTADDVEEDIYLAMDFLTTDKEGGTYSWQTSSSSEAGETLPEGLAQALYEQRTQSAYLNETMTVRLGETWPRLGDYADGLYLQSIDVDCAQELATLHFGQPEYLSAEDMRDLLNGFRGRAYSSVQTIREEPDEKDDDEEDAAKLAPIPPLSSTEFSPGTKAKTKISAADHESSIRMDASGDSASFAVSGGDNSVSIDTESSPSISVSDGTRSISLDTDDIPDECKGEIKVHKFTFRKADGTKWNYHILACGDIDTTEFKTVMLVTVTDGKLHVTYTDGETADYDLPSGAGGSSSSGSGDVEVPEITADKVDGHTRIYADGELIATIDDGHTPVITAEKDGTTTTIYADGVAIAQIEDGAGSSGSSSGGSDEGTAYDYLDVITGIRFQIADDKLQAVISRARIPVVDEGDIHAVETVDAGTIDICGAKEVTVVTGESYSTSTHQFTNTRNKIRVLESSSTTGQTPFTATALSSE